MDVTKFPGSHSIHGQLSTMEAHISSIVGPTRVADSYVTYNWKVYQKQVLRDFMKEDCISALIRAFINHTAEELYIPLNPRTIPTGFPYPRTRARRRPTART